MDLVVSTVQEAGHELVDLAHQFGHSLQVPVVNRDRKSIRDIKAKYQVTNVLVMSQKGPVVYTERGEFFFHIGMAELRIKNIINGKNDHMVAAMDLKAGKTVLDCTLGLGTDAIVASYVLGTKGLVLGLEVSPVIATVTGYGMQNFSTGCEGIDLAMRSVKVECEHYVSYLSRLPDQSFDIVYFDPMFRSPIYGSSGIKPVRCLADKSELTSEALMQACRVAKMRVVVKEARKSDEFSRLGIKKLVGGKYSSIQYGIIETGGSV